MPFPLQTRVSFTDQVDVSASTCFYPHTILVEYLTCRFKFYISCPLMGQGVGLFIMATVTLEKPILSSIFFYPKISKNVALKTLVNSIPSCLLNF